MKNSSIKKKIINAPISIGELVDKITILEIKKNKLQNSKLENVLKELSFLRKLMEKHQIWDLPVLNSKNELVGLLHLHAIIKHLISNTD